MIAHSNVINLGFGKTSLSTLLSSWLLEKPHPQRLQERVPCVSSVGFGAFLKTAPLMGGSDSLLGSWWIRKLDVSFRSPPSRSGDVGSRAALPYARRAGEMARADTRREHATRGCNGEQSCWRRRRDECST